MTILPKKKTPGPKTDTETGSEHGHGQVGSYRRRVTNECPGGESHVLLPANDNKEPTKQMIFNLSNFRPIHWVCQNHGLPTQDMDVVISYIYLIITPIFYFSVWFKYFLSPISTNTIPYQTLDVGSYFHNHNVMVDFNVQCTCCKLQQQQNRRDEEM